MVSVRVARALRAGHRSLRRVLDPNMRADRELRCLFEQHGVSSTD